MQSSSNGQKRLVGRRGRGGALPGVEKIYHRLISHPIPQIPFITGSVTSINFPFKINFQYKTDRYSSPSANNATSLNKAGSVCKIKYHLIHLRRLINYLKCIGISPERKFFSYALKI